MVKVDFNVSEDKKCLILKMKGHAGQAEVGRDLVCAVCSGYAYQLAQWLIELHKEGKLRSKPTVRMAAGDAQIVAKPLKAHYDEVANAYLYAECGYKVLAHNYPQYVQLSPFARE